MGTDWAVVDDNPEEGFSEWTVDDLSSLNFDSERQAWSVAPTALAISGNAAVGAQAPTWGVWAAEEFRFTPEEVNITPEQAQADTEGWTVLDEPS